jgi:heme/copper-type cytochrome/quinol oxidase subunit 4
VTTYRHSCILCILPVCLIFYRSFDTNVCYQILLTFPFILKLKITVKFHTACVCFLHSSHCSDFLVPSFVHLCHALIGAISAKMKSSVITDLVPVDICGDIRVSNEGINEKNCT